MAFMCFAKLVCVPLVAFEMLGDLPSWSVGEYSETLCESNLHLEWHQKLARFKTKAPKPSPRAELLPRWPKLYNLPSGPNNPAVRIGSSMPLR